MGTFNILANVVFVQLNTYQIESAMCKKSFLYGKIGLALVWLVWKQIAKITAVHSILLPSGKNWLRWKRMGNKRMHIEATKNIICGIGELMFAVYIWNCRGKECESTFY